MKAYLSSTGTRRPKTEKNISSSSKPNSGKSHVNKLKILLFFKKKSNYLTFWIFLVTEFDLIHEGNVGDDDGDGDCDGDGDGDDDSDE